MSENQALKNNGDCMFTFSDDQYKFLVRIDDTNLQTYFAQRVTVALEAFGKEMEERQEVDLLTFPKNVYRHFHAVCREDYGFDDEDMEKLKVFLENGYQELFLKTKSEPTENESIVNMVAFSLFLEMRKELMGLNHFPEISFSFVGKESKGMVSEGTLRNILSKQDYQA